MKKAADNTTADADEQSAVEFFERQRWGDRPSCVHCGGVDVYRMCDRKTGGRSARFLWRCRSCKRQYTVRAGTVLQESRIGLAKWRDAFRHVGESKDGFTAMDLRRALGISYRSALYLTRRLDRAAASVSKEAGGRLGLDWDRIAALLVETAEVQELLADAMAGR